MFLPFFWPQLFLSYIPLSGLTIIWIRSSITQWDHVCECECALPLYLSGDSAESVSKGFFTDVELETQCYTVYWPSPDEAHCTADQHKASVGAVLFLSVWNAGHQVQRAFLIYWCCVKSGEVGLCVLFKAFFFFFYLVHCFALWQLSTTHHRAFTSSQAFLR